MSSVAEVINYDNNDGCFYFTVDAGASIPKGTLVVLVSDPRTVTAHTGINTNSAIGIAAADKDPDDGSTLLAVYTRGVFDMVADGAITLGHLVRMGTAVNDVRSLSITQGLTEPVCVATLNELIGMSLETASDNEVVQILFGR